MARDDVFDALIRCLRAYIRSVTPRARIIYIDGSHMWGVIDADMPDGVKRCVDICAETFNLRKIDLIIEFREPAKNIFIDGSILDEVIKYLRCLETCFENRFCELLIGYHIYTSVEPYIVVARYGSELTTEETWILIALATVEDDTSLKRIRKTFAKTRR